MANKSISKLQECPICHQLSLLLNSKDNTFECLNVNCRETFFKATIDKYNNQIIENKQSLNELSNTETKAWAGNQYYDPKKKKWRDGKQPLKIKWRTSNRNWILGVVGFLLISFIITVILDYLFPGTKFAIFGW